MPQASRTSSRTANVQKDTTTKAQEQEFKRARGAISCAECRRLKLKCDKTVPCSSCKRRGCASICPNGSLTTGQGTRFILADTDRLHQKIAGMSDRIRQLEIALSILQSSVTREVHPLLRVDLLSIKSGLELHSAINPDTGEPQNNEQLDEDSQYIDAFGTLAVRDDGAQTFYGRSAGSESLLLDEKQVEFQHVSVPALPTPIARLSASFPGAPATSTGASAQLIADTQLEIEEYLPAWPRAKELCDLYLEQAPWFFGAITRRQLSEEVLPLFYPEAEANYNHGYSQQVDSPPTQDRSPQPSSSLTVSTSGLSLPQLKSPDSSTGVATAHDLALIFVVFCFGALTDPSLPPAPHNDEASRYYELTRAALNLEPVLDRPPSVATVQTLSLMGIYQGLVADENSIEKTWALMGLSSKLAQSIGLHRDCARWKLPPGEVQKRRALFWELFITDCWQSLATGRLPSFSLPYVDAELPGDPDQTIANDGTPQPSFPAWKAMWGKQCVAGVVEVTLTSRAPKYSLILDLDRKIRDVQLPKYAQGESPKGASLSETMKHFMPINYRELTLLYVHRCFFAQALTDHPTDPMRSPYAPSFLAGYRSACALISTVREQFNINPVQIARFWVLWTHAFSSAVMLASVVTHGGATKTAQAAFGELRQAHDLFDKAARYGGRAVKFLPVIRRLLDKAYRAFSQGIPRPRKDIFTPRQAENEKPDELSIFSGRTRMVATKSARPSTAAMKRSASHRRISPGAVSPAESNTASSDSLSASQSPVSSASESPKETADADFPSLQSYGSSVHPMLVDDMRSFEGQLEAQILNAQQSFYMTHASAEESRPATGTHYSHSPPTEGYGYQPTPYGYNHPHEPDTYQGMPPPPSLPAHVQATMYHQPVPPDPYEHTVYHQAHEGGPDQQMYAVPTMYGAVDSPPTTMNDASYQAYHTPPVSSEPTAAYTQVQANGYAAHEYNTGKTHPHPQHLQSQPQPHVWNTPYEAYPGSEPSQFQYTVDQPPLQQHYVETPTSSRPQSMHGDSHNRGYVQQHASLMPPPPMPSVLPVHTGGYSLQETWTSFMQHELPAPMNQGYQAGGRR